MDLCIVKRLLLPGVAFLIDESMFECELSKT